VAGASRRGSATASSSHSSPAQQVSRLKRPDTDGAQQQSQQRHLALRHRCSWGFCSAAVRQTRHEGQFQRISDEKKKGEPCCWWPTGRLLMSLGVAVAHNEVRGHGELGGANAEVDAVARHHGEDGVVLSAASWHDGASTARPRRSMARRER
jgi:hypothetical protein